MFHNAKVRRIPHRIIISCENVAKIFTKSRKFTCRYAYILRLYNINFIMQKSEEYPIGLSYLVKTLIIFLRLSCNSFFCPSLRLPFYIIAPICTPFIAAQSLNSNTKCNVFSLLRGACLWFHRGFQARIFREVCRHDEDRGQLRLYLSRIQHIQIHTNCQISATAYCLHGITVPPHQK